MRFFPRSAAVLAFASIVAVGAVGAIPARADDGFPFGFLMTLETAPQPGTKRLPTLEIGDSGEASLDLWCKSGQGQFSVAGNTVIFVPGPMQQRACSPELAAIDDELLIELREAANWTRQGDLVSFVGTKSLQFRINTN
ncbi:MAG: META domain-containing protein [Bradyrhizobium sp.]|nr:META domain-containing protein [Bradyrhizobium sp.]